MKLYVIRHAEAVEASKTLKDEWRYLTESGRTAAKSVSAAIVKYGSKPRLTLTSPLTRAVQTAEFIAAKACRRNVVQASSLLLPSGKVEDLIVYLQGCQESKRVVVVGHEPQMGALVAKLLGLEAPVELKKAGCVALVLEPGKDIAEFLWYQVPGKKCVSSLKKAFTTK